MEDKNTGATIDMQAIAQAITEGTLSQEALQEILGVAAKAIVAQTTQANAERIAALETEREAKAQERDDLQMQIRECAKRMGEIDAELRSLGKEQNAAQTRASDAFDILTGKATPKATRKATAIRRVRGNGRGNGVKTSQCVWEWREDEGDTWETLRDDLQIVSRLAFNVGIARSEMDAACKAQTGIDLFSAAHVAAGSVTFLADGTKKTRYLRCTYNTPQDVQDAQDAQEGDEDAQDGDEGNEDA